MSCASADVARRFGRMSGALSFVYSAVFFKFGLWQTLAGLCCGEADLAGVGTAISLVVAGFVLIQVIGNGFVYLYCQFRVSDQSRAQDILRQVRVICGVAILAVTVLLWFARGPVLDAAGLAPVARAQADSFWRWGALSFCILSATGVLRWAVLMDGGLRRCICSVLCELAVLGGVGFVAVRAMGAAGGVMLAETVADALGGVILIGHFRGRMEGLRSRRLRVSLRDVRTAVAYSVGDVLQCLCWIIAFAAICIFSVHRFGEGSYLVMSVLFEYIAMSLFFMGIAEAFVPLADEYRQKGDAVAYARLVRVARAAAIKTGLGGSVLTAISSPWVPEWVGAEGPVAGQVVRMLVILVPFLPFAALLMVRVAELFEERRFRRGIALILFKDLLGMAGLSVIGGIFWGLEGMWCGMLATLVIAVVLAFLPQKSVAPGSTVRHDGQGG